MRIAPELRETELEQVMIKLPTGTFRCECLCNVFTKLSEKDGVSKFRCNACQATYTGSK